MGIPKSAEVHNSNRATVREDWSLSKIPEVFKGPDESTLIDDWYPSNIPGIEVTADPQTGDVVVRDRRLLEIPHVFKGPSQHDSALSAVSTTEIIDAFLKSKAGGVSEASLTSYGATLHVFAKYCPTFPTIPQQLDDYFNRFKERQTAASAYAVIKLLYDFANDRYGLPNVILHVKRPRFKMKQPSWFTLDEAKKIVKACQNGREIGMIHLYLGHGLRLEEGVRVNIGDIADGRLMVRGKERSEWMPLLPETREVLLRLANGRSPEAPVFTGQDGRLSHKQAYNVIKAVLGRAGVLDGKGKDMRLATHTLRKSFATLANQAGGDRATADRLLRHWKRSVADLYFGYTLEMLQGFLERYSPIRLINRKPDPQPQNELHKTEY